MFEGKTKLTVVPEAFRFLQNGNRLNDGNFTDVPEKLRMVSRYWFMIRWDIFTLYISMREKQRTIKSGNVWCINMICWNKIEDFHIEEPTALSLGNLTEYTVDTKH